MQGVHNSRTVIVPSHTAAPVILHATEVKLAGPATTSKSGSDNDSGVAAAAHPTKRIHTRRRARKSPPDTAPLPLEPLTVQRGSAQHVAVGAAAVGQKSNTAASNAERSSAGHARALTASGIS